MLRALGLMLGMLAILHAGGTIRIATYNVENLFDLQRSGNEYAEYIPNTRWKWNVKNYRKKLKNIARVIRDIHPDIIGLQEIESPQALRDLQTELKRQGLYLRYRAIADAKPSTEIYSSVSFSAGVTNRSSVRPSSIRSPIYMKPV